VSPDGKTVLFLSWQSGWINYWTVPFTGGRATPLAPAPHDQSGGRWAPDGQRVAYLENHNGTHELRVVPSAGGAARALVRPRLGVVSGAEWSPNGSRISYVLETPTTAADLFTVDVATSAPTQLTFSAPGGNVESQLVVPTKISYRSDTLPISAYLYTPKGVRPGQKLPAIVFAHGGPTSQYNDTYEQQMQFFAGQGYVVLAPNFRGSSGYGRRFADLNNKCWAHCDLADLVAGVAYLKTLGYVDTDRVAVTGTSHGGLLSMAAATFAKGVFRATVPHGGTADRIYYYNTQELRHIKQAENEFGPLKGNESVYRYVSPFYWVGQVDTPQFVIWGEGEWPSSLNSQLYVAELERQYKPHRWKAYQGENYYVSSRSNVRRMLLDILDYMDGYLKDAP
jgi:dipeptidyl aminopeptidase/acylaminoacyl peptidase